MKHWIGCVVLGMTLSVAHGQAVEASQDEGPAAETAQPQRLQLDEMLGRVTSVPVLMNMAQEAFQRRDLASYIKIAKKMVELRPYEGEYRYRLAAAHAMNNDKSESYEQLLTLQRQGLYYPIEGDPAFENVRGYEVYDYLVEHLEMNKQPFGGDEQFVALDQPEALFESIAYDAKTKRLFAGSVKNGEIVTVDSTGTTKTFAKSDAEKAWGIFGLAVDSKAGRIWATTSSVPHFQGFKQDEYGQAALLAFDLATGKPLEHHLVPQDGRPHLLTNLSVAPNGDVYVSDSINPSVYRLKDGKFERFFTASSMTSLRGLAVGKNGKYLYFADYELGLFIADLEGQQVLKMSTDPMMNLGGIEGLYYWDDALIVIQNGIQPDRLLRVDLTEDGSAIAGQHPLSANQPQHSDPTFGAIDGDEMYYIANSQWGKYDVYGRPQGQVDPVIVMKTNLSLGRSTAAAAAE